MRITLPSGTQAEIARPSDDEPNRGLVLVPDIMGLRPLFDDLVARLAQENNWVVCAPELFPDLEDRPLEWRLANAGMVMESRRLSDFVAAADATGCEKVAIAGFCMGGMFTLKASAASRFDKAVAFYGMVHTPAAWKTEGDLDPLGCVASPGACPVLMIAGTADHWTPPEDLDALEQAGANVVRYEGAEHGFVHDASRPAHLADEAADAWRRAIEFISAG